MKGRAPDQIVISISLPKALLAQLDARAASLHMPRSRYLALLAKTDVERGGALMIEPESMGATEVTKTPKAASPPERALSPVGTKRSSQQVESKVQPVVSSPPDSQAESPFWSNFVD